MVPKYDKKSKLKYLFSNARERVILYLLIRILVVSVAYGVKIVIVVRVSTVWWLGSLGRA